MNMTLNEKFDFNLNRYFNDKASRALVIIKSMFNDEADLRAYVKNRFPDRFKDIDDIRELLLWIKDPNHQIPCCPYCHKPYTVFSSKSLDYSYDSSHRSCKANRYTMDKDFTSYQYIISLPLDYFVSALNLSDISKDPKVIPILDQFRKDYHSFSLYTNREALMILARISSIKDLDTVPVCPICNVFKCKLDNETLRSFVEPLAYKGHCNTEACILKYSTMKNKATCIEKYGVSNASQLEEVKQKKIDTSLEHYGVEHPMRDESVKQKLKDVMVDKYGVENISQLDSIKTKKSETVMKHYGVTSPMLDQEIKERQAKTVEDRYGVNNISQCEDIKQKKIDTTMKHYGVTNPSFDAGVRNLISEKIQERNAHRREVMGIGYKIGPTSTDEFTCLNILANVVDLDILRQYAVNLYRLDGYIEKYNVAIEYDDIEHFIRTKAIKNDMDRQSYITNLLGCTFFRIDAREWKQNQSEVVDRFKKFIDDRKKEIVDEN